MDRFRGWCGPWRIRGSPLPWARGPAEARRAPALTLSSWATWAFCRYTEYRTAVTTELVPRRMNWPREGRPPLSMAEPSPGCRRGRRGGLAPRPSPAACRLPPAATTRLHPEPHPLRGPSRKPALGRLAMTRRRNRKWAGQSSPEGGVTRVICGLQLPVLGLGFRPSEWGTVLES